MKRRMSAHVLLGAFALFALLGCAPRLKPLPGAPAPRALPRAELPPGHHRTVFNWQLEDTDMLSRGDGAARITSPDTGRLDFFLAGGLGSGAAVLIGNDLRLPSSTEDLARRLVPPAPMLWAALGRLAIPPMADTTARVVGDTLRADLGRPVAWRITFVRDTLRRVERIDDNRVVEWVDRAGGAGDARIRYRHPTSRRQLDLTITRSERVSAFDPSIWLLP